MRDALKTVFGRQITLEDGSRYQYTITQVEILNILGIATAILDEYLIIAPDAQTYKLYKTKERNWYDISEQNKDADKVILEKLKRLLIRK